ncbi:hydrogenase maturation nickel metallochaperone HypA [Halorussus sp. MSC15.2]|uniref:hydrogenase maturation nickel metallochaperone HypA n=1 Tax=Halorussus sp. MSC15.2 TaxID=2283638 RepID=UPI0013D20B1B|nr:hydrogenase maturation nickel metallochaperone HypA [Halorussus sp. MSC15.2]NEU57291.1 hydrogenase maturation nickel metallochaperone HypA [Halorussus sp. MSC15.2]
MGIVDSLKRMVTSDGETGVELKCTECGETFERPLDHCPNCGSDDVKEVGGFDMRPDT